MVMPLTCIWSAREGNVKGPRLNSFVCSSVARGDARSHSSSRQVHTEGTDPLHFVWTLITC